MNYLDPRGVDAREALETNAFERVASKSAFDLIRHNVDEFLFLSVLSVAFPDLVIVNNMVFLAEQIKLVQISKFPAEFSAADSEKFVNHIHLWDIIKTGSCNHAIEKKILYLLAEAWKWWVPHQTGRDVNVFTEDMSGSYGCSITFSTRGRARKDGAV